MDMSGLNMNPLSWTTSKNMGELRTYLALDEHIPVCFCPDVILVAKMRVQVRPILSNATDTGSILNLMPDDLMVTGCISKIIRWSGGDFVEANKENLLNLIDNDTIPILSYSPI
jgi:hypothetical protein